MVAQQKWGVQYVGSQHSGPPAGIGGQQIVEHIPYRQVDSGNSIASISVACVGEDVRNPPLKDRQPIKCQQLNIELQQDIPVGFEIIWR